MEMGRAITSGNITEIFHEYIFLMEEIFDMLE